MPNDKLMAFPKYVRLVFSLLPKIGEKSFGKCENNDFDKCVCDQT